MQAALWNRLFPPFMASCFGVVATASFFCYQSTTESGNLFFFFFCLFCLLRSVVRSAWIAAR